MLQWLFISVDGIMRYRVLYTFSVLLASWSTCFSTFKSKFLGSPLYVDKCGFVWRSSLYSASLCFMDFSMPLVIHSLFCVCIC